jgi:hypothetical protein
MQLLTIGSDLQQAIDSLTSVQLIKLILEIASTAELGLRAGRNELYVRHTLASKLKLCHDRQSASLSWCLALFWSP